MGSFGSRSKGANVLFALLMLVSTQSKGAQINGATEPASRTVTIQDCRIVFGQKQLVAASQSGILASRFSEGDVVKVGEQCGRLNDDLILPRVATAEHRAMDDSRVQRAKEVLASATRERTLAEMGNKEVSNAYPESEVEKRRSAERLAALDLASENSQLQLFKLQLKEERAAQESLALKSRIDGLVTRTFKNPGEGVTAGENVLEVVNTGTVRVEGYVKLRDLPRIRRNRSALVIVQGTLANAAGSSLGGEVSFDGRVTFIDVFVQPLSGAVKIWVEVDNRDGALAEGMSAQLQFDCPPEAAK